MSDDDKKQEQRGQSEQPVLSQSGSDYWLRRKGYSEKEIRDYKRRARAETGAGWH